MIKLRKSHPALTKGGFKILFSEDEVFAFARFFKNKTLYVIINNNIEDKLINMPCWHLGDISGVCKELFSQEIYELAEGHIKNKTFSPPDFDSGKGKKKGRLV